jgi:hypothetical protein
MHPIATGLSIIIRGGILTPSVAARQRGVLDRGQRLLPAPRRDRQRRRYGPPDIVIRRVRGIIRPAVFDTQPPRVSPVARAKRRGFADPRATDRTSRLIACLAACAAWFATARPLDAQDLEPRAYSASPIGVRFVVAAVSRSTGGVLVDPSLPVEDVEASVNVGALGVGSTFALFGRTALLVGVMPYALADASGRVGETARSVSRSGLADPRIKLAVNLLGGRAMRPSEFAKSRGPTIAGVSVSVVPPVGQYYPTKLINLGANRWSFKPEVGISRAIQKWTIEGYSGVWLFTANDSFYLGESRRTQQPVLALQAHASYTMRPQLWVAFDATWYTGGSTSIDGMEKADLQRNSRLGTTLSLPVTPRGSFKISYSAGATTRIGGDFNTIGVAWQWSWIAPERPSP